MASAAQAAYNQRVLEGLKGFSGVHSETGGMNWDEMVRYTGNMVAGLARAALMCRCRTQDGEDDMDDVLEFADGMRYEVPQGHPAAPTDAEVAAFREAQQAEHEAAALQTQYEAQVAAELLQSQKSGENVAGGKPGTAAAPAQKVVEVDYSIPGALKKAEIFEDDFDRKTRDPRRALGVQQPLSQPAQAGTSGAPGAAAGQQNQANGGSGRDGQASARTLYNEKVGRLEPYAGKQSPAFGAGRGKDRKGSPPAVLQRPGQAGPGRRPSASEGTQPRGQQQQPLQLQKPVNGTAATPRTALGPPSATEGTAATTQQQREQAPAKSPWAKLPPVAPQSLQTAQSQSTAAAGLVAPGTQQSNAPAVQTEPQVELPVTTSAPQQSQAAPKTVAEQEEEYKRQMAGIAERARKRREQEELESKAAQERTKQRMAELEARLAAAAAPAAQGANASTAASAAKTAPLPAGSAQTPTLPSNPSRQTGPHPSQLSERDASSKSSAALARPVPDRSAAWRRSSASEATATITEPQRKLWQPTVAKETVKEDPPPRKPDAVKAAEAVGIKAGPANVNKKEPAVGTASTGKAPPSAAAFSALADITSASWRRAVPAPPAAARTAVEAMEPVVAKSDSVPLETDAAPLRISPVRPSQQQQGSNAPPSQSVSPLQPRRPASFEQAPTTSTQPKSADKVQFQKAAQPQVKLGKSAQKAAGLTVNEAILLSHAFPQPTIIVPGGVKVDAASAPTLAPPSHVGTEAVGVSAIDKIMLAVRTAQDGLKTDQSAIRSDLSQASRKPESRRDGIRADQSSPASAGAHLTASRPQAPPPFPRIHIVPEVFDVTSTERPPTPKNPWKVQPNFRLPKIKKSLQSIAPRQERSFYDPAKPPPIYSNSWTQPKHLNLPRYMMLEEHLHAALPAGQRPRVKVSALHLPSADVEVSAAEAEAAVKSGTIVIARVEDRRGPPDSHAKASRSDAERWRSVSISGTGPTGPAQPVQVMITQESITVKDPPDMMSSPPTEPEDYTTVSFREDALLEGPPSAIRVSLPKSLARHSVTQQGAISDTNVSKVLEPKYDSSAADMAERDTPAQAHSMFFVPSEIGTGISKSDAITPQDAVDRSLYAPLPQKEPSGPAKADTPRLEQPRPSSDAAISAAIGIGSGRLSTPASLQEGKRAVSETLPAFPSLSPGANPLLPGPPSPRSVKSASSPAPMSTFEASVRHPIPEHVLQELKKLNEAVSSVGPSYWNQACRMRLLCGFADNLSLVCIRPRLPLRHVSTRPTTSWRGPHHHGRLPTESHLTWHRQRSRCPQSTPACRSGPSRRQRRLPRLLLQRRRRARLRRRTLCAASRTIIPR